MEYLSNCLHRPRYGTDGSAVFVTHGMQCDSVFSQLIAKHMKGNRSVYGFQAPGMERDEPALTSIEAMANRYLKEMQPYSDGKPFVLLGFCAGGHVAMEMAHQLGRKDLLKHLILVDAPRHQTAQSFDKLLEYQVDIATRRQTIYPKLAATVPGAPETVRAYGGALRAYKSKVHKGKTSVLASRQMMSLINHPTLGWKRFVPQGSTTVMLAEDRSELLLRNSATVAALVEKFAQ